MKNFFMKEAIKEAQKSLENRDVPVGCVIVYDGKIISRGHNTRHELNSTIGHAEVNAINDANKYLNNWILDECDLYVSVEPCEMCSGAIIQARLKKVYYCALDYKAGCVESLYELFDDERFNHQVEYESGILKEECEQLLKDFFKNLRRKK